MDFHRDMGRCQMSLRVAQSFPVWKKEQTGRLELPLVSTLLLENQRPLGSGSPETLTHPEDRDRAAGIKDLISNWKKR